MKTAQRKTNIPLIRLRRFASGYYKEDQFAKRPESFKRLFAYGNTRLMVAFYDYEVN